MSAASNANAYLRTKVMSASPEELRLMLLDGALKFARQGREGLANSDYEASYTGFSQCRAIIVELISSMRPETAPELCERVRGVYTFMYNELVSGSFEKDVEKIDTVIELLEYERETWRLLMDKLEEERRNAGGPADGASISVQG